MTEVVTLPTAASSPPPRNHRRGPLPKTIANLGAARFSRAVAKRQQDQRLWEEAQESHKRERREKKERLIALLSTLLEHAQCDAITSIVAAVDYRGRSVMLYGKGEDEESDECALLMATRLQIRFANRVDQAEE